MLTHLQQDLTKTVAQRSVKSCCEKEAKCAQYLFTQINGCVLNVSFSSLSHAPTLLGPQSCSLDHGFEFPGQNRVSPSALHCWHGRPVVLAFMIMNIFHSKLKPVRKNTRLRCCFSFVGMFSWQRTALSLSLSFEHTHTHVHTLFYK